MAVTEEDEWEYEYDENETENLYITLDLSNIPVKSSVSAPTGSIRPSLTGHPMLLQSRLRALNAVRRAEEPTLNALEAEDSTSVGALQIKDLHTTNPLIMYNGQLLSCKWASTIGTDMFFVKSDSNDGSDPNALRSLPSVDLLGMSSTKLMATAARFRPRDEVVEDVVLPEEQTTTSVNVSEDTQQEIQAVQTPGAQEELPDTGNIPAPSSGFLNRLNQAKAKRGDKTTLITSTKSDGKRLVAAPVTVQKPPVTGATSSMTEDTAMEGMDK